MCGHVCYACVNASLLLGQIETERGVGHDIAALWSVTYPAPQIAVHIHDLISLFDPAGVAPIEAIPVPCGRFIDVAVRSAAAIQRDLVRTPRVTDQRRTVAGRGPGG